jgi:hypothetical protein
LLRWSNIVYLTHSLSINTILTSIDLNCNNISDKFAEHLSNSLSTNSTFQQVVMELMKEMRSIKIFILILV